VSLGHQLISGQIKRERIQSWLEQINRISGTGATAVVTCFRGGMRSQLSQQWIKDAGIEVPRVAGGYKRVRQLLIHQIELFCQTNQLLVLSGKTGSGKTNLIKQIQFMPTLDLEALAHHRGSAFGALSAPQPSQIDFENQLALELYKIKNKTGSVPTQPLTQTVEQTLVEDESLLIGRVTQPADFFNLLRSSPIILLEEPLELRIQNTLQEYVANRCSVPNLFSDLQSSLLKIRAKLGGLRHQEIHDDIEKAHSAWLNHKDLSVSKIWIEKVLVWYYDPIYEKSLTKRNPTILARGDSKTIFNFLKNHR